MEELKELIYAFAEQNVACFLPGFQNIKSFGCYKYTKRGMVMMENLTHVENWNLKKRPKLVGIKKLWMVWDDI